MYDTTKSLIMYNNLISAAELLEHEIYSTFTLAFFENWDNLKEYGNSEIHFNHPKREIWKIFGIT